MQGTRIPAEDLRANQDTVVDRAESGRIKGRYKVLDVGRCLSDPGNVHVVVRDATVNPKAQSSVWCCLRVSLIEIL